MAITSLQINGLPGRIFSFSLKFNLADSLRLINIESENRINEIELESRQISIALENRIIIVGEDKMAIPVRKKDPNAILDYGNDWSEWLEGINDTISTSTWIVPSGITSVDETDSDTATTIWLSGGTVGTTYRIINRIVTTGGRTEDRSIDIMVENR